MNKNNLKLNNINIKNRQYQSGTIIVNSNNCITRNNAKKFKNNIFSLNKSRDISNTSNKSACIGRILSSNPSIKFINSKIQSNINKSKPTSTDKHQLKLRPHSQNNKTNSNFNNFTNLKSKIKQNILNSFKNSIKPVSNSCSKSNNNNSATLNKPNINDNNNNNRSNSNSSKLSKNSLLSKLAHNKLNQFALKARKEFVSSNVSINKNSKNINTSRLYSSKDTNNLLHTQQIESVNFSNLTNNNNKFEISKPITNNNLKVACNKSNNKIINIKDKKSLITCNTKNKDTEIRNTSNKLNNNNEIKTNEKLNCSLKYNYSLNNINSKFNRSLIYSRLKTNNKTTYKSNTNDKKHDITDAKDKNNSKIKSNTLYSSTANKSNNGTTSSSYTIINKVKCDNKSNIQDSKTNLNNNISKLIGFKTYDTLNSNIYNK